MFICPIFCAFFLIVWAKKKTIDSLPNAKSRAGPPFMVETVSPYVARLLKCGPLRYVDNGHLLARKTNEIWTL